MTLTAPVRDGEVVLAKYLGAMVFQVFLWAPTLLILSNRFDRYADKATKLPGQLAENLEENRPPAPMRAAAGPAPPAACAPT